jgi:pyridoxal phosphate enzyme (YggS family)
LGTTENDNSLIQKNLERVLWEIDRAAAASGRRGDDVRLLVVTKGQPVEKILAAYSAGARRFGENYPEETLSKIEATRDRADIEWHMIGHLQSRKTRIVAQHFTMLHSLDSLSLAQKLERALAEIGRVLPVLIEVNVGGEESKDGYPAWDRAQWDGMLPEFSAILALEHLAVRGLMTMPPYWEDAEQTRPYFQRMRALRDDLRQQFPAGKWDELSMGTSVDYSVAIQEGATYVRVGTAIVGSRPPKSVSFLSGTSER